MNDTIGYLLLRRIRIENANAISSPITYGFPAITGFLGAVHALSRALQQVEAFQDIALHGVLIACHDCQPQVYRANAYSDYSFVQTRNPVQKDGKTAAIVEEGRAHLTVTLAIEVLGQDELSAIQAQQLVACIQQQIFLHRMAGGSVRGLARYEPVRYFPMEEVGKIQPLLLPAFVLMEARQDLLDLTAELQTTRPEATALDALIDLACLHHVPVNENGALSWQTRSARTGRGWLVPMPVGYQAIAPMFAPGELANCRTSDYPAQYVEAVYSLGKWVFPNRIEEIESAFWRYQHQPETGLYLVTQQNG